MAISNKVDVVIAEGEPARGWERLAGVLNEVAATLYVAPDPDRRFIVLAPSKRAGTEHAAAVGIDPVAIVTPRSMHGARGLVVDEIIEAPGLSTEERAELMAETSPALVTSSAD
ncbi:hypothetical protein DC31_13845 [Microbacterium sp. CH12i]|uniref:hypothetical protein n=1 Tax=Microbacterium sp. CH12i TaxID=1479651 RepID=UPI000461583B|nr:hypothetical protein [Microbacterium sp. CH12i]KDA05858.1 hypothetical protein DC31_13845 [Microbacterium sp. CH12i]